MLSARERRTVAFGVAVSVLATMFVYGFLPMGRRWQEREVRIAIESARLGELRGLLASEALLEDAVAERARLLDAEPRRLLAGRTPALAAAGLQSTLQAYADRSFVTVSRLDVAGAPDSAEGTLPVIPATLSAVGDLYGVIDLLTLIQSASLLIEIEELSVRPNPALRGELLQVTLTLRVPYLEG
jgi:hypothetical protein